MITRVRGISGASTNITMAGTCEGLHNILHMPSCSQPVISVGSFLDQIGGTLEFTNKHVFLRKNKQRVRVGQRNEKGLYATCMSPGEAAALTKASSTASVNSLSVHAQVLRENVHRLHRSLGHIGKDKMLLVMQRNQFTNLTPKDLELLLSCDACHSGKIRKANRPKQSTSRPSVFGHTVRSDSTSKQVIRTTGGKKYANVAVDEATRWAWVTLLRTPKHAKSSAIDPLLRTELNGLSRAFGSDGEQSSSTTKQTLYCRNWASSAKQPVQTIKVKTVCRKGPSGCCFKWSVPYFSMPSYHSDFGESCSLQPTISVTDYHTTRTQTKPHLTNSGTGSFPISATFALLEFTARS